MDRKNIFVYNSELEDIANKIDSVRRLGQKYGFKQVMDPNEANIIVSIGGDGAFLQAIRKTGFRDDCLYVGVNDGKLGFYTDFDFDDISSLEAGFQADLLEVQKYPVLEVSIDNGKPFNCLNECTVRSHIIKTFAIDVFIDDLYFETFRGDGMVVSTPTGSTAYNKSLGGAVVDPSLKAMQLTEIASLNNNEYRTLSSPLILSGDRQVTLKVVQDGNEHPIIAVDNEALGVRHIREVKIKMSEKQIKTLKLKDNSFFHKVKRSFL